MKNEIQITRIEATDKDADNSTYEFKMPYTYADDYGNTGEFYRKETRLCSEYDTQIVEEQAQKEKELQEIKDKQDKIEEINQ